MFDDAWLKLLLQTNRKPLSVASLLVLQCIGQSAPLLQNLQIPFMTAFEEMDV